MMTWTKEDYPSDPTQILKENNKLGLENLFAEKGYRLDFTKIRNAPGAWTRQWLLWAYKEG